MQVILRVYGYATQIDRTALPRNFHYNPWQSRGRDCMICAGTVDVPC